MFIRSPRIRMDVVREGARFAQVGRLHFFTAAVFLRNLRLRQIHRYKLLCPDTGCRTAEFPWAGTAATKEQQREQGENKLAPHRHFFSFLLVAQRFISVESA
jgi:hypothetical protein